MDIWNLNLVKSINELFWHEPFYAALYAFCLLSLLLFWKQMKRGRRFFLIYSVMCLVIFIYNPVFVNLITRYFLNYDRVTVRLFELLPVLITEAYVLTSLTTVAYKKNKTLAVALTVAITCLFLFFGVTPWNREKVGYGAGMYVLPENVYKIPQEHLDICDCIMDDMDGNRAVLSMYEIRGINDFKGTLNYSIRMYTSRIQLDEAMDIVSYVALTDEERVAYWDEYIAKLQGYETDNSTIYFLFPLEDERASDLLAYGCCELPVNSENYQVLAYTPSN